MALFRGPVSLAGRTTFSTRSARESALKLMGEARKCQSDSPAVRPKLDHVHPPFAALAFADESLSLFQPVSHFLLGQAAPFPGHAEFLKENAVVCRSDALIHRWAGSFTIKGGCRIVQDGLFRATLQLSL